MLLLIRDAAMRQGARQQLGSTSRPAAISDLAVGRHQLQSRAYRSNFRAGFSQMMMRRCPQLESLLPASLTGETGEKTGKGQAQ